MKLASLALALSAVVCSLLADATSLQAAEAKKPNLLIFLSDDVGWGEYGFQGNKEIPTPNIDSLAKNGLRFTQGYVSAPLCSPSRAGLMTGRYQTRFGHDNNSLQQSGGIFPFFFTCSARTPSRSALRAFPVFIKTCMMSLF